MPLRFPSEPPNGSSLVHAGLQRLAARVKRPGALQTVDFNTLMFRAPHAVYDLRADEISRGGGLETAHPTGFRYLIHAAGGSVAAAEIHTDAAGAATLLANVNYGPFVEATARALVQLTSLDQVRTGSYEVRLLRFSAIALMAVWLKSETDSVDLIYPLAPAPEVLQPAKLYTVDDFLNAILPMARRRAAPKRSNAVP
jgi:hypothetical protein